MPFQAVLARQLALLGEQLSAAAAEDAEPLVAQIAELTASRDRLRTRAEELSAANDALSLELESRAADREMAGQAAASLAAERERVEQVTTEFASLEQAHAALRRQFDEQAATLAALQRSTATSSSEIAAAQAARDAAEHARAEESAARESLQAEIDSLRAQLAAARSESAAESARLRDELSLARSAADGENLLLREELSAAKANHRGRLVTRLAALFEELARSASVDEVLSVAADGIADDFPRVAVFTVNSGRLEPRYQRGFEQGGNLDLARAALDDGSFLARAGLSTELGLHVIDARSVLPFPGSPSRVVTAPIVVRGELLALIYADDDGRAGAGEIDDLGARVADIVRRHTSLRLERLTVELRTIGELRAYAKMLVDEIEYVYRADVSARKPDGERLERLTENLRCARQIYQQRAASEGPAMADLLEEVVSAAITARAATPYGRELASVAPLAHPAVAEA